MNTHIRRAQPTNADADAFADLANMASHEILAGLVGPGYASVLTSMFMGDDTLYRARQVWFVDLDGEPVGMLCAFNGHEKAALNAETDRRLLDQPGARSPAAVKAQNELGPIAEFIDTVPTDAFYVQFVAVQPHARGNGYAGQLMAVAEELAREAGAATLELDVETGNPAAFKAYHRQGLAILRTSAEVAYETRGRQCRSVALHRMVKAIG